MPKLTLLEMTQNILSAMDSDEVNSIFDTVESMQVAEAIRDTYYEMLANYNVPSYEQLRQLEPSTDDAKPTYLRIADDVKSIKWFQYDYQTDGIVTYKNIDYLPPEQFLNYTNQFKDPFTEVEDFSGVILKIGNNENPKYWTTFDNEWLICDSYNSTLENTLQESKTLAWAQIDTVLTLNDESIPDLDVNLFPLLLAEAKSSCFINFKQVSNSKEEQRARRQRLRLQNDFWRADQRRPYNRTPDYGRRRP